MTNNVFRKSLVIGIIILFLGVCLNPVISGNFGKISDLYEIEFIDNFNLQYTYSGDPPDEEWNKTYGGSNYDYDVGYCVQQTKDEGYIISGCSAPPGDVRYSLLVKTDAYGIEQWNKSNGELPGYAATSVHQTNEGTTPAHTPGS